MRKFDVNEKNSKPDEEEKIRQFNYAVLPLAVCWRSVEALNYGQSHDVTLLYLRASQRPFLSAQFYSISSSRFCINKGHGHTLTTRKSMYMYEKEKVQVVFNDDDRFGFFLPIPLYSAVSSVLG